MKRIKNSKEFAFPANFQSIYNKVNKAFCLYFFAKWMNTAWMKTLNANLSHTREFPEGHWRHENENLWKSSQWRNLKSRFCVLVWTKNIMKTELFQNDDVTIITWSPVLRFSSLAVDASVFTNFEIDWNKTAEVSVGKLTGKTEENQWITINKSMCIRAHSVSFQ